MKFITTFVLLFFLLPITHGNVACIDVPAVAEHNKGSLINICIENIAGNGTVFSSIKPIAGGMFQESVLAAYSAVSKQRDLSNMDLLIRTNAEGIANHVDGPSAGVAIGVMIRAITENKTLDASKTITGGLDQNGAIIPVGAVPEKVEIAYKGGKRVILVPPLSIDDNIIIYSMKKFFEINVSVYDNFDYAYSTLTSSKPVEWNVPYPKKTTLELAYPLEKKNSTQLVSSSVDNLLLELNESISRIGDVYPEWYPYFSSRYAIAHSLYEKGFTYSAGNEAFLALYRARMLLADGNDLTSLENKVIMCNESLAKRLSSYNGSTERYVNAELRYYWMQNEMEGYIDEGYSSQRIARTGALEKAMMWCSLANDIISELDNVDRYDLERVREIDKNLLGFYERGTITEHLAKARDAYERGFYGASLLEIAMHESVVNNTYDNNLNEYSGKREWTNMLVAHSEYLNESSEYSESSSIEINRYAYFLDMHLDEIEKGEEILQKEVCVSNEDVYTLLILVLIFVFAVAIILLLKR